MSRISASLRFGASLFAVAIVALSGSSAHAVMTQIGLNFTYNGNAGNANATDQTILASGDTTGVVSQANWNTITFADWYGPQFTPVLGIDSTQEGHPTSGILVDSTGASTSVNVKSNVGMGWYTSTNTAFAGSTATEKLLYGFAYSNSATISINGLDANNYNIYAYFANNYSNVDSTATLGATSYYFSTDPGQASSFTLPITNTTPGDFTQIGNYVEWAGVLPSAGTISFSFSGTDLGTGLAGLQIIEVPEPTTAAVIGLGSVASLMIRRRKSA